MASHSREPRLQYPPFLHMRDLCVGISLHTTPTGPDRPDEKYAKRAHPQLLRALERGHRPAPTCKKRSRMPKHMRTQRGAPISACGLTAHHPVSPRSMRRENRAISPLMSAAFSALLLRGLSRSLRGVRAALLDLLQQSSISTHCPRQLGEPQQEKRKLPQPERRSAVRCGAVYTCKQGRNAIPAMLSARSEPRRLCKVFIVPRTFFAE